MEIRHPSGITFHAHGEAAEAPIQPARCACGATHLHAHVRPSPVEAPEPPIQLSPEAPHRLRRAEDFAEVRIRIDVWTRWLAAFAQETPHAALMHALDDYRRELTLLAVKRCGAKL
jgi:hypothetical protein